MISDGSRSRWALGVNGTSPGPTLHVKPGDRLRLKVENRLGHSTNVHTHGLRVSPSGNADNPFLEIKAGANFDYQIDIPKDHPSGLFWYHPHLHHRVAEQIFSGFFGAIVVEDEIDLLPEFASATERLMLIHDTRDADTESGVTSVSIMEQREGRQGDLILVNGTRPQQIFLETGSLERWRVLNASASRYYSLKLDGHALNVVARDGGRLQLPERVDELVLVPGERAEVFIRPVRAGSYRLRSSPVSRGPMAAGSELELAEITVVGADSAPARLPAALASVPNLGAMKVVSTREIALEMQMGGGSPRFLINGKEFDANRIDTKVQVGTVEDWVLRNVGNMDHPFHLHIWPFQVMESSLPGPLPIGWKDVVNVPAGESVRIRIPFDVIGGKTVYHCHILDHEDMGMMAVIEAT